MKIEDEQELDQQSPTAVAEHKEIAATEANPKRRWWIAVLVFAIVVVAFVSGILPRVTARSTLRRETDQLATPTVSVIQPKKTAPSQEIVLPANVQPYINSPIYARTNGYLKRWYADIGAKVKKGQLLAEIETPEIDQQLLQARANLATAEANLKLSQTTAVRYQDLLKSDSVSQQETDNAVGSYNANKAIVQADEANVKQLEALQSFEKVYAPFDGLVTARNTDIGALITAGSGGTSTELFRIAQPGKLRVYVNVPQAYSQAAKPGLTGELALSEFPGRRFVGKLVRTADAIDPATRTLLTEIDVDNPTGNLLSGAYAEVHLKLPSPQSAYILPVNALLFRSEGLRVATVDNQQHAKLRQISMGRDFGSEVEVVAGLEGDESIILDPPDSIVDGQTVRVARAQDSQPATGSRGQ
jgi:RND family efflux transporter MFP subunit